MTARQRTRASVVLLALVALSIIGSAQAPSLRLVSTAWPPFTNAQGQTRFALDLVEAALSRIGLASTTTIVDASRFTQALLGGEFDGSGAAWKDPERERALVFSQPYLENRLVLVGKRGSDVSASSMSALKGKRIAIVEGYSYGDAIDNSGPVFVRSASEEDSLSRLLAGTVEYTLMDDLVVQFISSNYAEEARTRLQFGSAPVVRRQLYMALSRSRLDSAGIIGRFNAQLRSMIADHTYHRLLHVSWIQADIDGDGVAEIVSASDRPGPTEPTNPYSLFSLEPEKPAPAREQGKPQRYYFGGSIYNGWTQVPDMYKVPDPPHPDPNRSAVNIFRFTW